MGIFTKRSTPSECTSRISNAMDEVRAIVDMLDATTPGKEYKSSWPANRKYAEGHLFEAEMSLGAALNGLLAFGDKYPTWNEKDTQQTIDIHELRAEVKRLQDALALSRAHATGPEVAEAQQPRSHGDVLADKVRRLVMGAVHPDNAADAAEREWRTRLCQKLFPEIDGIMKGA